MKQLLGHTVITMDMKYTGIVIGTKGKWDEFCMVRVFDTERNCYTNKRLYGANLVKTRPPESPFLAEMQDPDFWTRLHEVETEVALISNDREWFESIQEEKKMMKPETID